MVVQSGLRLKYLLLKKDQRLLGGSMKMKDGSRLCPSEKFN